MTTITVKPAADGFFLVRIWVVDHTLSADELRTLRAEIDAALGDAKATTDPPFCPPDCKWLNFTESEQGDLSVNYPHVCKRHDEQVVHAGHCPNLVKLSQCKWQPEAPCDVCELCTGRVGCDGWTG